MDEEIEIYFRPFRRYCMMLTSQPSISALDKLKELQQNTEPRILQRLQEYVMLPMQMYLRSPTMSNNYTISVLEFVRDYYTSVKLTSKFLMTDLLQSLLPLLTPNDLQASIDSGSKQKNIRISLSEDMKVALCNCLTNLIRNAEDSIKNDVIYNADYKLPISHLVFQVLEWCEKEDITEVVLSSLNLVNELCYNKCISNFTDKKCSETTQLDENIRTTFVLQFAQMLPGITSRLIKVLVPKISNTSNKSQGNSIKAKVIMVWCNYVCALLCDRNLIRQDIMDIDEGICDTTIGNESNSNLLLNDGWIGKAQDHLLQHLQVLSKYNFIMSEKYYLRNVMYLLCEATLFHCSESLKCFNSLQVEILAVLCVDENSAELAKRSEHCLSNLLHRKERKTSKHELNLNLPQSSEMLASVENTDMQEVVEQTQSRLFEISQSIISSSSGLYDEVQLHQQLSQLNGFIVLLKNIESSCLFFHSETYLGQLLDAILSVISFEKNVLIGDNLARDYTNFEFILKPELYLKLARPQKSFKHLSSETLKARVISIIAVLAKCANIRLIIEYLTQKILPVKDENKEIEEKHLAERKEVLFLLNEIVNAMEINSIDDKESKRDTSDILDSVIELYLNLKRQELIHNESTMKLVSSGHISPKTITGDKANIEWTECCLLIEGLGMLALTANRHCPDTHFKRNHLGEVLVFVLSETNLNKSHSAHILYYSLNDLADANKYPDVASMLKDNLDYLCRELAILLRKHLSASSKIRQKGIERPEGLPTLLKAILAIQDVKCEKVNDLPELRDTVEVLLHQLDLSWIDPDKSITTEILQVITIFTKAFSGNNEIPDTHWNKKPLNDDLNTDRGVLTQLVKDIKESDAIERKFLEDKMNDHCPETGFHGDEEDKHEEASYETENEEKKVASDKIKFLRQTIEHTRHFISMVGCPQWQLLSLGNYSLKTNNMRSELVYDGIWGISLI